MKKELMSFLKKQLKFKSYRELADDVGVPPATLWRVVNQTRNGSFDTWDKIHRYRASLLKEIA